MPAKERDLFAGIASFPALYAASLRAARGKRAKPGAAAFLANLEKEVLRLERELRGGVYRPGRYKKIEIFDPKHRVVSAAPFRDRVAHHAFCAVCEPLFERGFIADSFANRRGKGTHRAVARYERFRDRFRWVLRCDIYRYFPAVDHEILKRDLRRRIACRRTLDLADRIVDGSNRQEPVHAYFPGDDLFTPFERRRGLPIGNLTSQFFANVYLDGLDHYCKEALRAKGYLRYVDDFALFADERERLEEWRRRIAAFLQGRRLRLHPRKTRILETRQPTEFLGFVLLPGGWRRLPEANVRRFRNRLRGLRDRWQRGRAAPEEIRQRVEAWIAHASHADTWRLRRAIFRDGWFDPSREPDRPPSGFARRFLEQQSEEPPCGEPQQERYRKPQQQQRLPSCPHAQGPEPAALRRRGESDERPGAVMTNNRAASLLLRGCAEEGRPPHAKAARKDTKTMSNASLWKMRLAFVVMVALAPAAGGAYAQMAAGKAFRDCPECPQMVVIPAGSFLMGSPESEEGRYDYEGPVHRVEIGEPFAVGAYEVTRDEYGAFVSETGHGGKGCLGLTGDDWKRDTFNWRNPLFDWGRPRDSQTGRDPVVCVSWEDAQAYVEWLSRKTREEYRLLSEAEWEYAARAGTTTRYSFGDEVTESDANYRGNIGKTQPVGSYGANGYGLYDMHGNVREWVEDCWNDNYEGAPTDGKAWESGDCGRRVLRGGSWSNAPLRFRAAYRFKHDTGICFIDYGFRVARVLGATLQSLLTSAAGGTSVAVPPAAAVVPDSGSDDTVVNPDSGTDFKEDSEIAADVAGEDTETTPAAEETARKRPGRRFRDCAECPQMVVLPAGSFMMGSPESEEGRDDDEGPMYEVRIEKPFAVGVYEVTFEEWDACAADGGCRGYRPADRGWGRGRQPVINVSWDDTQSYVSWLRGKTGEEYRLLSEAEWEYAARAGTTTRYSFGDEITEDDANYGNNIGKPQPVGSYEKNGFGLYDMHGNVWEWVQDCWRWTYRGKLSNGEAWELFGGGCSFQVWRGGSWGNGPRSLRAASRGSLLGTESRLVSSGFRVARTLAP